MKAFNSPRLSRKGTDRLIELHHATVRDRLGYLLDELDTPSLMSGFVFTSDGTYQLKLQKVDTICDEQNPAVDYIFVPLEALKRVKVFESVFVYDGSEVIKINGGNAVEMYPGDKLTLNFRFEART